MKLTHTYNKHYKKLFVIPILLVVIALGIIINNYVTKGDLFEKDVSLKGGITATISTPQLVPDMEEYLKEKFPKADLTVRSLSEFGTKKQAG
ncbi:hypothetical protein D6777_04380, partial [Candidatus Woesearchaeota archaeon]